MATIGTMDVVDHQAVMAAIDVFGEQQREMMHALQGQSGRLDGLTSRFDRLEDKVDETNTRVHSLEEGVTEIKELLVRAFDK